MPFDSAFDFAQASLRAPFASFADAHESNGGGGGSRTRVRKHVLVGLYMRIRFWVLMSGVRKRLKTAGHQTRYFSRSRAGPPRDCQPV